MDNTDDFLRARADYLSFRPQRTCDRKTIASHLKFLCSKIYDVWKIFGFQSQSIHSVVAPPTLNGVSETCQRGSYSPPSFFRISDEMTKVMGLCKGSVQFSLRNFSQTSFFSLKEKALE